MRLALMLTTVMLAAGCGPPCGRSADTAVTGSVDGEEVAFCHAFFGINVDLGSHIEQQTGAPVHHGVALLLAESDSACEQADSEDPFSPPGSTLEYWLNLDEKSQHSDSFFTYHVAGHDYLLGSGDVAFSVMAPENLPQREDGVAPYPDVRGRFEGSVQIQLATSESGEADKVLGSVQGSFVARHCEQIDGTMLE